MATISIECDRLEVRLTGWQAIFALKRQTDVPVDHVVSVSAGTVTALRPNGLRAPGTYVQNVIAAGSYWWKSRGWSFWSVRHPEQAVDIRLRDSHYSHLVIEVVDPHATVR